MRHEVTEEDTALALGSGDVRVLGTPRLIAWMEAATLDVAERLTRAGQTTVGTGVRLAHHRPTPVGGSLEVVAEVSGTEAGRRITFHVNAVDERGQQVADGEIDRVVVDRERFTDSATRHSGSG